MKKTIVVWFSCGAASAVAAKYTLNKYRESYIVRVVNTPVQEEEPDNRRFLQDVEKWIDCPIEIATSKKYPSGSAAEVWKRERYMSGPYGAKCTVELKKESRYQWEKINSPDYHVLGFTLEEKKRHDRFILSEIPNVLPILIDAKITKQMCFNILKRAGLQLPKIYDMGYPNANCIGCIKITSPTYWNHVRKMHPNVFNDRIKQSREIGCKLVELKGDRIFLDQLPPNARGRNLKNYSSECGIFCEITN